MRIARAGGLIVAGVALAICLLVLIGAHVCGLPLISPVGSTVLSIFGPWLVVVPIAAGAFGIWAWRAAHSRGAMVLTVAAAIAATGGTVALARMVAEAHHHGVRINLVRAFGMRVISRWPPDEDHRAHRCAAVRAVVDHLRGTRFIANAGAGRRAVCAALTQHGFKPQLRVIRGHNHLTQGFAVNTVDDSLSAPVLDFLRSCAP